MEGYALCVSCSETWVRNEVARRTDDRCPECFAASGGKRITELELVGRGMKVKIPIKSGRKRAARPDTPERAARRREARKARVAARKRLAAIFPDLYDVILADERASRGLEPWPVDVAVRGNAPDVDVAFAELAAELEKIA